MTLRYFFIFLLLSSTSRANVVENLLLKFSEITKPSKNSSRFNLWSYDQFTWQVINCAKTLKPNKKLPSNLKFNPRTTGAVGLPGNLHKYCKLLSESGLRPVCVIAKNLRAKNVIQQKNLMNPLYLQVYKNTPFKITGALKCYLNKEIMDKNLMYEFYPGDFKTKWKRKPKVGTINFFQRGPKQVEYGTLEVIEKSGAPNYKGIIPYKDLRTTVLIEKQ